jgi:hypothetical protein
MAVPQPSIDVLAGSGSPRLPNQSWPLSLGAGQTVEIRWSGIPKSVGEMELLLSLDGGRTFPVRLTEEIAPDLEFFSWVVPNLSTETACLALRMGLDGREITGPPSTLFQISPDRFLSTVGLLWRNGEIWANQHSPDTPRQPAFPTGLDSDPGEVRSLGMDFEAADVSRVFPGEVARAANVRGSSVSARTPNRPYRVSHRPPALLFLRI